jgi:FkbM family methyltransferase
MSFISYAQNYEDVMLWRALKHIDQGFYIDVGANDPDIDSVTKAFYERGWRGINVEPAPQWFERLEKARPRDINLQLALGSEPGAITLYEIPDTGLSTAEKKFAERHEAERGYQSRELRVEMDTLSNVCERFHLEPIHFLKIDVEGAEKAVLQGADFGKIRPWIVLVEATLPNSQEESYYDWEPLLLNAGYEYAYFDGLNRYYVSGEHENLKAAFKAPPNVFDDFVISKQIESERRAEARAEKAEERAAQVEDALRAVYRSRSWRITWPLRWLARNVRLPREKAK